MKGVHSSVQATEKMVLGEISGWEDSMEARRLDAVSLTPGMMEA